MDFTKTIISLAFMASGSIAHEAEWAIGPQGLLTQSPFRLILVQYSDRFMHGFVKFLIVLLRCVILYNAMHKFVGVLDNPLPARGIIVK